MATDTKPGGEQQLDDVMLAMDVVDTLRHRQSLVERELDSTERDDQLITRLRAIYASQGIQVPDHVLAEGVEALREQRFVYKPPAETLAVKLARVYVARGKWAKRVAAITGVLAALWLGYVLVVAGPAERERQEQAAALERMPEELARLRDAVRSVAKDDKAVETANQLHDRGIAGLRSGDVGEAAGAVSEMKTLLNELQQVYTLRIVSRPGAKSGVWRIPEVNPNARNYYIIVEAVTPEGEILPQTITSEEDGRTTQVSQWGLRVDESVFNRVRADKQDDGIIQNRRFGAKQRGYLAPEYFLPTTGGAITRW